MLANAASEQWILRGLGDLIPDQCRFGSIERAKRTSVVDHLVIPGTDRYVPDRHFAQRDAFALILLTD
jgi:hypothetical protein